MIQTQFADLTSGYERFDALRKNLEGIFAKVNEMKEYRLDIGYYEKKFEEFKKQFELADDFLQSNKMPFESMQKDYEMYVLTECNKSLEKLTVEFEENITPIYNIYLLFRAIDEKIKNEDDEDIDDVIKQTIMLINQINGIYAHNKIEITSLIERAYRTIYDALLYEEVYKRHDILDFLKKKNLSSNRENIGKVIREQVNEQISNGSLDRSEVDEELIEHIDEGLGYDYISPEFLSSLSRKSLVSKYEGIRIKNQQMKSYMQGVISDFQERKELTEQQLKSSKSNIRNLRINTAAIKGKVCALVLVPIIAISAGHAIGTSASNKITEYATTTRVVDLDTGEIVGEPQIVYDENVTTYVATITIYDPWKKNPTGYGYIRNAAAYEFVLPEGVGEDYHVKKEDIVGNLKEKYRFNEPKNVLSENDSMTDSVIYVTETYQDKSVNQKSKKYILPFSIIGGVVGGGIDFLLLISGILNLSLMEENLRKLKEKMANNKKDQLLYKKQLLKLKEEAQSILEDKKRIEEKYGIEIDSSFIPQIEAGKRH